MKTGAIDNIMMNKKDESELTKYKKMIKSEHFEFLLNIGISKNILHSEPSINQTLSTSSFHVLLHVFCLDK